MNRFGRKKLGVLLALILALSWQASVVAASNAGLYIVAVCRDANAVEIIDGDSMKSLARIPVGEAPHEAIVSSDGRTAYVTNYGTKEKPGNSLSIIDLATLKETKRIDLGDLTRPHGLQEVGGKIYFTAEAVKSVARFDPKSGKVDWRANTDQMVSHMIAVSADGKQIYTANMLSASVTAIDASGAESKLVQIPVGKEPEGITLSPDGKTLWIGHRAAGLISIIDTATNKVIETLTAGQMPLRLSHAPDGKRVYAVSPQVGAVVVFDAATRKESGRITIDGAPVGLMVSPDSKRVFVTDLKNSKVFALDAQKLSPIKSVPVETLSDGIGLAFAEQSAQVKADFSGTWKLDTAKSSGLPPGMEQTMTVRQTGDTIKIVTIVKGGPQGEQTVPDSYTLDGKETDFTPLGGKGKRTAKRNADGSGIEVIEKADVKGPDDSTVTIEATRKWSISADGKTLTIDMKVKTPQGEMETKRIFVKQ